MWVKFNDKTPDDPEIDNLSDGAFRLWFAAICYCQAELTDGFISTAKVRRLTPNYRPAHLRELTAPTSNPAGPMFQPIGQEGYAIRNFTKWNKTRDHWERKREADAARLAEWRAKREQEPSE